jgi:hypothetical protein
MQEQCQRPPIFESRLSNSSIFADIVERFSPGMSVELRLHGLGVEVSARLAILIGSRY